MIAIGRGIMRQFLRCGLVFTFSGVLGAAIATDALLGIGDRATAKTNIGALKEGYVNIAVHGHLPVPGPGNRENRIQ